MEPTILMETDSIVVLNKPAGLVVHGDGKVQEPTLADWILSRYPETKNVGEPLVVSHGKEERTILRPGIVHRLDRETTGVIVVAKTQEAFLHLKEQFQKRTTKKEYIAIVWNRFKEQTGVVDAPIGRSKTDIRKWATGRGARGLLREAVTEYQIIKELKEGDEVFSVIRLFPKTGRTHQIRVHMASISHPLVGDMLYAPGRPYALGIGRVALHARAITFLDIVGNICYVEAPFPDDLAHSVVL